MKSVLIRVIISLFLCCCIVLNVVSIPARASAAGAVGIIKASTVTGNPYVITAALLIALGIYAGLDSGAFETVANNCVDALEAAGTWVKDGVVELLRTEDADGNASYYLDSGLMEDVKTWSYNSGIIVNGPVFSESISGTYTLSSGDEYSLSAFANVPISYASTVTKSSGVYSFKAYVLSHVKDIVLNGKNSSLSWNDSFGCYASLQKHISIGKSLSGFSASFPVVGANCTSLSEYISSSYDVSIGSVPVQSSDLTDGTSARQWSEEYTDRGLKVYGGGSGNNNNDGKWFWKVMIPLTAVELLAMSQADQWSGETPKEFDDYSSVEEFEIVSRPEVEFGQGLELAPVTSPSPDPGIGTNPDTGTDTDPDTGTNTGTNFLQSLTEFFTPSGDITMYSLDLKDLFPFCIPFDIYDFLSALSADPVAPVFEFDLNLGVATEPMKIDLSNWSDLAAIMRTLELGLFCVGLALKTRELIGG